MFAKFTLKAVCDPPAVALGGPRPGGTVGACTLDWVGPVGFAGAVAVGEAPGVVADVVRFRRTKTKPSWVTAYQALNAHRPAAAGHPVGPVPFAGPRSAPCVRLLPVIDSATTNGKGGHPDTSTIFVMGLVGLIGCLPLGICAWYFGNRLLRKYDAEPGRWDHRGWVEAGRLMGIIGVGVLVVELLFWVIFKL